MTLTSNRLTHLGLVLFLTVAAATGCGHEDENPDVEGCEHLKEGPASAVTAAATATGAMAIAADHKRYDVSLVDVTGGKGGVVTFAAAKEEDYIFFLSADVPVKFSAGGMAIAPESMAKSSPTCAEIKARYVVPLKVGTTQLDLGPTTQTSVGIVVEAAAHEH